MKVEDFLGQALEAGGTRTVRSPAWVLDGWAHVLGKQQEEKWFTKVETKHGGPRNQNSGLSL